MRTKQQIDNLRMVFRQLYGPLELFMTDLQIDEWANTLQKRIDEWENTLQKRIDQNKYAWMVKIKLDSNKDLLWKDVKEEPTAPYASEENIRNKAMSLLSNFPGIVEIELTDIGNEEHKLYFMRNDTSH